MGHEDRNSHKNSIKRSGQARLVYVFDIKCNFPPPQEGEPAWTGRKTKTTYIRNSPSTSSSALESSNGWAVTGLLARLSSCISSVKHRQESLYPFLLHNTMNYHDFLSKKHHKLLCQFLLQNGMKYCKIIRQNVINY